jgi:hypothetical protein
MHGIMLFPNGLAGVRALSIFILERCMDGEGGVSGTRYVKTHEVFG